MKTVYYLFKSEINDDESLQESAAILQKKLGKDVEISDFIHIEDEIPYISY